MPTNWEKFSSQEPHMWHVRGVKKKSILRRTKFLFLIKKQEPTTKSDDQRKKTLNVLKIP